MPAAAPLAVLCSECSHEYRVKPEAAGRAVKCPKCQHRNPVETGNRDGDGAGSEMEWLGLAPVDDLPATRESAPPVTPPAFAVRKEPAENSAPVRTRDQRYEPRNYPALGFLRIVYYVLAVLVAAQWVLVTLFILGSSLFAGAATGEAGATGGVLMVALLPMAAHTAASAIAGCTLVACAEMIRLALDVQDDTRRTAIYASRIPVK